MTAPSTEERVEALRRARPRSRLLRSSAVLLLAFGAYAWCSGEIAVGDLFSARRMDNLHRFLTVDVRPRASSGEALGGGELVAWVRELLVTRGAEAVWATLWISILAIVLAGALAVLLGAFGARTLMTRDPFAVCGPEGHCARGLPWRAACQGTRVLFVLLRAVPEYVLAFLLLALLGPTAWPAVLALALHNAGILGRLGADTVENVEPVPLRSLRMLGARRRHVFVHGVGPLALPRFLLYFFYRFETCVREATVLGMLGVVSLGYWILEARAHQRYDELLVFVALGAGIVVAVDLASQAVRAWIRDET